MRTPFLPALICCAISLQAQGQPIDIDDKQFTLLVTADTQIGPAETTNPNLRGPNQRLQAFVEKANELDPAAVIFVGDVTFGGDAASVDNFVATVETLAAPALVVRGETDQTQAATQGLRALAGDADGYWDVEAGQWRLLAIPPPYPLTSAESQRKVLDRLGTLLKQSRRRPTIVFHHYPLLPVGLSSLEADALPAAYRGQLVDALTAADQVRYVISGHAHAGVQASERTALTYRDTVFLLAPTLINPRAFGEEYSAFRADLTDRNNGFYLQLNFDGDDVALVGAKLNSDYLRPYPAEVARFDEGRDPRRLTRLAAMPANRAFVNGGFENDLADGWWRTYRYRALDGRGAQFYRDRNRRSEGRYSAGLRLFPRGSAWTRDESAEFYQHLAVDGMARPRIQADYWVTGTGRSHYGGGYIRLSLYGSDDRPRAMIFHWGARESRTVYLQQIFAYHDTGRAQSSRWLQQQNAEGYVLAWEIPDDQGRWHELDLDVAYLYDAYHGEGAYQALGVERMLFAFGVWLGPEMRSSAEGLIDNVRLNDEATDSATAGGRQLPVTPSHRGSPYGLWTLDG